MEPTAIPFEMMMEEYDVAATALPIMADESSLGLVALMASLGMFFMAIWGFFAILMIVVMWRIFSKAGQAGWKILIPIYNIYIYLKIIGRPGWWLILYLIPLVNFVIGIITVLDLGKVFGKSALWSILLIFFLNPIGLIILAFGGSKYQLNQAEAIPQS